MKALSLFSGAGGDTLGMTQAGIQVTHYSEKEKKFYPTHDKNFQGCSLLGGDITKIEDKKFQELKGNIDVIFAGFPCQSFSHGGKKDPKDPRGQMYLQFARAARLIEPTYIVGENVKGLLSRKTEDGGLFIDCILEEFQKLGYTCHYKVFNVSKYGVPQSRERLIIVGKRNSPGWEPSWPREHTTVPDLTRIVEFSMEGATPVPPDFFTDRGVPPECILRGEGEPTGEVHRYLTRQLEQGDFSFGKRVSPTHCEIVDIRKPSKTIICSYDHQPRLFVALQTPTGNFLRPYTVKELQQIQGFPRDYSVEGNLKDKIVQIGNAVPPPLISQVCEALTKHTLKGILDV